ncbi:MAG: HEAT repeat domain-containing protein [Gemmataceae bacterium]|nr:HEAT repeat domain-containing protein [Gemmataceae bacterium]
MNQPLRYPAILCACLFLSGPASAQKNAQPPDPDPELERKSFIVADGFEVNLFAADPLLAKPIQMNFDAAGRLWVACSEVYPQIKPGQKANDKVLILEDTKGMGKADKVTIFADGLLIPTGVEPGDGGAYVADSTDILHFSDPDTKGKARKKRVVLSGFGTEDTHHIIHTFRWGPEGMLYFNQSVYIHSHVETPHGPRRLNAGGIWQLRPDSLKLEVFCRGFWNTWGHHFDRWGQSFATDGAGDGGIHLVVPGASYAAATGGSKLLPGLNPGSPKYCGLEILSGRHLPEEWRGNMIANDFRAHRVCRFVVREDGSGFASQQKADLIKTNHAAFRPIDVKMGPDGAIYIADWYNPIIQHGEVDFRDPRRDLTHGRIWRVTAKGRPLVERPKLVDAKTPELLEALKAPEDWTRHFAKRVLKERGAKAVLPDLTAWVQKLDAADPQFEHHLLEALWTFQSLDVVEPKLLARLLQAKDHHARAAAVRALALWHTRLSNPVELLAVRIADDHPEVRLEAVRALGQIPGPRSAEIAMQALDRPTDRFIDYALYLTLRELAPDWLPALQKGTLDFGGNPQHLVVALQAIGAKEGVAPLVALLKSGKIVPEREESALLLIAALGGPPELTLVFDKALAREGNPAARQVKLLVALEQAAGKGVVPTGDRERLAPLLKSENETVRASALRLAGSWKLQKLQPELLAFAKAAESSVVVRQAAIDGLAAMTDRATLADLAAKEHPLALRRMAVIALSTLDTERAAALAVEVLAGGEGDASDVFTAFIDRKNGVALLAKALADKKLPADVAKVGVRAVRATGRDSPALIEALTKAGNLTNLKRELTAEELAQLVAEVQKTGNAARGEGVFRRKDQVCLKCHAIAGAGGQVGPDLTSIGASAQIDYLIESILLPNKVLKEGYHSLIVTTTAGKIHTGIKVRESKTELVLRDAEDREITIGIKEIDERANGPSLMPEGLSDPLTRAELVDLVRFLSELGKVGPYAVSQARVVRRWQALEPTDKGKELLRSTQIGSAASNDPVLIWGSAYSHVSGALPLDAVPAVKYRNDTAAHGFLRCQLDVTTGGKVKLLLNSMTGLTAWLDGVPLEIGEAMTLDLKPGVHTLTLALDLEKRRDGLRLELDDVPNSPARVRIVGGK